MSCPLKLAPLQTSLRHVRRSAHNADSRIPRITRTLKCAPTHLLFLHWVLAICYIIVVTALFSVFSLSSGIDATAVVLTVEVIFVGEFDGTFVAVLFFEVGWEMLDVVDFCQFFSDFVNLGCVFQRADGKGGGKIVIAALFCQFCCFFHAEAVAFEAAFAAFGYVFEAFCHLEEFLWVVVTFYQFDRVFKFHGVYKTGNFMDSFAIFFFRVDVWVVIEYCDVEIFRQVFQYVTAAGCTAAVEKQAWDLVIFLRLIYKFFQFFLIVSFIQQYYYILSASSQMLFIIF